MIWSSEDILRFLKDGEDEFNSQFPIIIDRYCLALFQGVPEYTLPEYITNIRRITYMGTKLDPMPHRYFRDYLQGASTQVSKPFWYIFNNLGQNVIRLFPIPDIDVPAVQDGLWSYAINYRCIIEFYRTPDESQGFILPHYMRRRLLKLYVLRQCFSMENQGQNLKSSKYFEAKWSMWSTLYGRVLYSLHSKPRKLIISSPGQYQAAPGRPLLPIDRFGVGVRTGE